MNIKFYIVMMVSNEQRSSVIPAIIDSDGYQFPFKDTLKKMQQMFPGNHVTLINWKRVSESIAKEIIDENNEIKDFLI